MPAGRRNSGISRCLDGARGDGYTEGQRREARTMREEMFSRETMLVGQEGMERLRERRVAVFGLGGVGGHAAEALHGPAWVPWT